MAAVIPGLGGSVKFLTSFVSQESDREEKTIM